MISFSSWWGCGKFIFAKKFYVVFGSVSKTQETRHEWWENMTKKGQCRSRNMKILICFLSQGGSKWWNFLSCEQWNCADANIPWLLLHVCWGHEYNIHPFGGAGYMLNKVALKALLINGLPNNFPNSVIFKDDWLHFWYQRWKWRWMVQPIISNWLFSLIALFHSALHTSFCHHSLGIIPQNPYWPESGAGLASKFGVGDDGANCDLLCCG